MFCTKTHPDMVHTTTTPIYGTEYTTTTTKYGTPPQTPANIVHHHKHYRYGTPPPPRVLSCPNPLIQKWFGSRFSNIYICLDRVLGKQLGHSLKQHQSGLQIFALINIIIQSRNITMSMIDIDEIR